MTRMASLTPLSQRLTPVEVARLWFRRGPDFAGKIRNTHPDFPKPGPDGLFLLTQVEAWFDRWHGRPQGRPDSEEEDAMQAARGIR